MPGYSRRLPTLLLASLNSDASELLRKKETRGTPWDLAMELINSDRYAKARKVLKGVMIPMNFAYPLAKTAAAMGDLDILMILPRTADHVAVRHTVMYEHWDVLDWYDMKNSYISLCSVAATSAGLQWCRSKGLCEKMYRPWALVKAMLFGSLDEEYLLQEGKYTKDELIHCLYGIMSNQKHASMVMKHMVRNMNMQSLDIGEILRSQIPAPDRDFVRKVFLEAGFPVS